MEIAQFCIESAHGASFRTIASGVGIAFPMKHLPRLCEVSVRARVARSMLSPRSQNTN
jgi:hypothetical protein